MLCKNHELWYDCFISLYHFFFWQDFNGSVNTNKPAILETIVTGEQFARENQARLLPEQEEELQRKTDELRTYFDTVENKAAKIDGDTKANIDKLEWEMTEEVGWDIIHIS